MLWPHSKQLRSAHPYYLIQLVKEGVKGSMWHHKTEHNSDWTLNLQSWSMYSTLPKWINQSKFMPKESLKNSGLIKYFHFILCRGDVMYSMGTIVNNTLWYTWKLLKRTYLETSHHKEKKCNYVWWQMLLCSFHNIYRYYIIMLCTWD